MPNEATKQLVLEFLQAVQPIPIWIDGGWGVDALLNTQTRSHADLDVIIAKDDLAELRRALTANRFVHEEFREGLVFTSDAGLQVDVHLVRFDERGYGIFDLPDGAEWPLASSAFSGEGKIGDRQVRCLSPEAQVLCHAQGYEPSPKDLADMQALQCKFQLTLPSALSLGGNQCDASGNSQDP